jgi:prepilin-type N-terminal cleavage/methylation domain-containing protein
MKSQNGRGFTLVEVVLVIAIIALLAGISYAAMGPAREAARRSQCLNNLRQIGQALRMYMDDHRGQDPTEGQGITYADAGLPTHRHLRAFTERYVKNRAVLACPNHQGRYPASRMILTYAWVPGPDRADQSRRHRFSSVVEKRGLDTPVALCEEHNAGLEERRAPRWQKRRVGVLRLGGAARFYLVPLHTTYEEW